MTVGTKQLKNQLSKYLDRVRRGETVHVTAHGKVVAEIRPVEPRPGDEEALLTKLEAEELVTRGQGPRRAFRPVAPRRPVSVSRLVIEDRR